MTKLPSAKIRDSLEQRIIEGELGIGKRLDEAELSAHYGVSRTRSARHCNDWPSLDLLNICHGVAPLFVHPACQNLSKCLK